MANLKRTKIINGLKSLTEGTVTPDEVQKGLSNLVTVAKDELNLPDEREAKEVVAGLFRENEGPIKELNQEVMNSMIKQYGSKEAAEKVYYATANKQDRDPENFHTEDTGEDENFFGSTGFDIRKDKDLYPDGYWGDTNDEKAKEIVKQHNIRTKNQLKTFESDDAVGRGIEAGMNPESGEDEYEDYRKLKDMLTKGGHDGEEEGQIDEENNPVKLKSDVAKVMAKLDMSMIEPYLKKIDNPVEQAEMIAQFAEKIGVPKTRLSAVIGQLKILANKDDQVQQSTPMETKMTKGKLIETIKGKKQNRVIKTVKVKDIK